MIKNLAQYYWKQQRSLLLSNFNTHYIPQILMLNIYLNVSLNVKQKNLKIFWIFYFILNRKPNVYLKKTQRIWNVLEYKLSFNKKNLFFVLNKSLVDFLPNTSSNNIACKISNTKIFIDIYNISSYLEIGNLFYNSSILEEFSFNFYIKTSNKLLNSNVNLYICKLFQIPNIYYKIEV